MSAGNSRPRPLDAETFTELHMGLREAFRRAHDRGSDIACKDFGMTGESVAQLAQAIMQLEQHRPAELAVSSPRRGDDPRLDFWELEFFGV